MKDLLVISAILFLFFEAYRGLRRGWLQRLLMKKRPSDRAMRKPAILRPKSEKDCPYCQQAEGQSRCAHREMPIAWSARKGRGGPKKRYPTEGYFCSNPKCAYYGISDEKIHALVWDGRHRKYEVIRDLKCQACGKKFSSFALLTKA